MLLFNCISVYFLIMAIAAVYCAAQIHSLNGSDYARTILFLCFAICIYILGYAMEINAGTRAQILFWNHIEYLGIPYVSALWLTVGLMYTGHGTRHKGWWFAAIYVIPIITMILRFTDDFHHLYFSALRFVSEDGRLVLVKEPGPWNYVQLCHSLLMILVALGLFIYDAVKSEKRASGKVYLVSAASFFAVGGLLLSLTAPFGIRLDYMALCLPLTCVLVILSIARYDFLETKSIARSRVFEASRDAILLINRGNRIIDYNGSAQRLFRRFHIDISQKPSAALLDGVPGLLGSFRESGPSVIRLRAGGQESYYEVTTEDIFHRSVLHGRIKTIRDVTETYKLNEDLKRQAMLDELSGLNNRRAFMQIGQAMMAQAARDGAPVHLMMMDLDRFKDVNDRYGHPAGDRVIRRFSRILRDFFGTDALIARLGGEEFAVMLAGAGEIVSRTGELMKKVEEYEYAFRGGAFHVTVSIGVAKRDESSRTLEGLLRLADKALYRAKDHGRNCFVIL